MDRNWPLVAAGAMLGCVAVGAVFALAVLLGPMGSDTGWSRAGLSSALTLAFLSMGVAGFGWGVLSDRIGPRRVVLCGAVLLGLALVLASRAQSLLQFQLSFGVLLGIAAASFFTPVMAATAASFDRHRNLAVSLVSAGVGVAPLTLSPLVAWLVTHYDWRITLLVVGLLSWVLTLPAVAFVRGVPHAEAEAADAPADTHARASPTAARSRGHGATDSGAMTAWQALRTRPFLILAGAYFACCAAHSGPIFHTVSYAIGCGLPITAAVTIYSMEGAAGLGGRLMFGVLADRFGAKHVLVAGLLIQAVGASAYLAVNQLGGFYAVAVLFGMAYGGTMPLYASLARQVFPARMLGTLLGAAGLLSSIGMALGPLVGGWLFDRFGSYAWMYIGSTLIGLAAACIALFFPAGPRRPDGEAARLVAQPQP
jgi:MFS family permease